MNELKALTRQHMRTLWQTAQAGAALQGEDALLVKIMQQHHEYAHLWARLDELPEAHIEQDGVNPILHVHFHHIVENQIAQKNPPAVAQVIKTLLGKGLSRHEAIHIVAGVAAEETFAIVQQSRPFDEAAYVRKLRRLALKTERK
ncbi:MAG: DUF1841 family protein [Chloroflexota bacterium]